MTHSISKILEHMCIEEKWCVLLGLAFVSGLSANTPGRDKVCDANAVFQQVNALLSEKQYDRAAKALDEFQQCQQRSPLESFQMGWLYGRARHFDSALKMFTAVPENVPDRLTHDYAVALTKFELGNYQGAIDILKPLNSSGQSDAKSINLLAVSYSKAGLYQQAYAVLAEQTQNNSADLSTYLNLVTVCAEGGDFAQAANVATQAAKLFPNSPDVFIARGAANTLLGHLDKAHDDFTAAAGLAPTRADARFFLALIEYKQGKFSEAIAILKAAIVNGIADSELHYLTAECLLKLDPGNREQALRELDRAVDLNSNSTSARTLRGKLLFESGRPADAVFDLEFANRHDPESRAATYNLARVYQALGRTTQAKALFSQLRAQKADTLNEFGDKRLNEALGDKGAQEP